MITKEWLEKEIDYLNELEKEAVERLQRAIDRVKEAQYEELVAREHRTSIRACIEEFEKQLEQHF